MQTTYNRNENSARGIGANAATTDLVIDGAFVDKIIPMINDAKTEIRICAYAWRWYMDEPELPMQKFNIALFRKSCNGCKVRILVDNQSMRENFKRLGFNVRAVEPTKMLHTKAICIDKKSLVIGSHNLTKRAGSDNYEMSIITQEFEPVEQFIEYFDAMWGSRA
jgi:phosphatidylserine/phosphatidylglycerophosphate/cardiolipin synthase-like enzyme